jgi:hypothetical protein
MARGRFLLQSRKLGLGLIPRLDGRVQLCTGSSGLCPRLDQLFKQIGANPVEPGDLILWGGRNRRCRANSKNHENGDAKGLQGEGWHCEGPPLMSVAAQH